MSKHILGTFSTVEYANAALTTLEIKGYKKEEVSIATSKNSISEDEVELKNDVIEGVKDSAKAGGVWGGILGLLVGIGVIAIPGLGFLFVTGPVAAAIGITGLAGTTVSGALTGTLVGGIAGALKEIGVDENLAKQYEKDLGEGKILVGVKAHDADGKTVRDIFENNGAKHISDLKLVTKRDN